MLRATDICMRIEKRLGGIIVHYAWLVASETQSLQAFQTFLNKRSGITKVILAYDFCQMCANAYRVFLYRTNLVSRTIKTNSPI